MAFLWEVLADGLTASFFSLARVAFLLVPLLTGMELAKEMGWLEKVSGSLAGGLRRLFLPERAALPLATGLIIGFTYGAGVILAAVREGGWTRRELTLLWVFLSLNHAIIEDTAIFAALGLPALGVLAVRLVPAVMATGVLSLWLRRRERVPKRGAGA
ncbi:nucleoside recognition domain-containing protein [Gelria sp. Kuro-4]|uniref:nucleoside recognition domain-containing protein n=1 Tax=Gelria sp. Kuro-4 TaxID=2796927 RepID=UPI001BEFBAFE|nr:nucleoside recognition domain-containing protein [Gelria sp. Kuro-4]BCV24721.1 hypothetical protein kuro4_14940 [Gelria sp. Kuro-4]